MAKEILIVDDEFDDLVTMKDILSGAGYVVKTATNGVQALDLLVGNGFDLVLLDIRMPTLSGYDLLRLLRERLNHKAKMIYISIVPKGDVDMDDADGFIQKPFSPEKLLAEVKKTVGE
jgi:CheY-like chemotaxis protein